MHSNDPLDSEQPEPISDSAVPEKLIFESELWMVCPKGKY